MLDVAFVSAFLTVLVIVPILRRRREAKKREQQLGREHQARENVLADLLEEKAK